MNKENKKSLNDILDDYHSIESRLIENDGELDDKLEELLKLNTLELGDKLDGYEGFIKYLNGQIAYLKTMESHYLKRRKILDRSMQRCKDSMVHAISITDMKKIKTSNYNFSVCESESWTVDLDSMNNDIKNELIDKGFAENILKLSMNAIKAEYKTSSESERPKWIDVKKKPYMRVS